MSKKNKSDKNGPGALFIPAGILTGMGVGIITGNIPAGMFIGLGIGFALFAVSLMLGNRCEVKGSK